ncbi:hypothetical protein [Christiangramia sp.]|uniref:hypothetical protein n=1 Tax=Christiangramia sp. TaxID=1931228 RepID=UPI00260C453E|nr:hypothetical protein [Christiangramia sp.]
MSGSILQAAKADAKKIITSGGFEVDITLSTPSGDKTFLTTGLGSKHHLSFDTDGMPMSSKQAHVCVDEQVLLDNDYPVRNANGEIDLYKHKVSFKDSSGIVKSYVVREQFPNETLGLITLILGDWQQS